MPDEPAEQELLGQYIPLHYHYNMLTDLPRMGGFKQAIELALPDGGKALELGGGTGVLSFFAAAKASKVWCVERNPELAVQARRLLALNGVAGIVELVEGDALAYLPPEPVDVVICEMLHSALLREKQVEVIASFRARYAERFATKLPQPIPLATILALQPVEQSFEFEGYYAPVPLFQDPGIAHTRTHELAPPITFQMFDFSKDLPDTCGWDGRVSISDSGSVNAIRFITKNVLAVNLTSGTSVDWYSQHLVMPLREPLPVQAGNELAIRFSYAPGAQLDALDSALIVERV